MAPFSALVAGGRQSAESQTALNTAMQQSAAGNGSPLCESPQPSIDSHDCGDSSLPHSTPGTDGVDSVSHTAVHAIGLKSSIEGAPAALEKVANAPRKGSRSSKGRRPQGNGPVNAFILFSMHFRPTLRRHYPDEENAKLSIRLGNLWRILPRCAKLDYERAAKEQRLRCKASLAQPMQTLSPTTTPVHAQPDNVQAIESTLNCNASDTDTSSSVLSPVSHQSFPGVYDVLHSSTEGIDDGASTDGDYHMAVDPTNTPMLGVVDRQSHVHDTTHGHPSEQMMCLDNDYHRSTGVPAPLDDGFLAPFFDVTEISQVFGETAAHPPTESRVDDSHRSPRESHRAQSSTGQLLGHSHHSGYWHDDGLPLRLPFRQHGQLRYPSHINSDSVRLRASLAAANSTLQRHAPAHVSDVASDSLSWNQSDASSSSTQPHSLPSTPWTQGASNVHIPDFPQLCIPPTALGPYTGLEEFAIAGTRSRALSSVGDMPTFPPVLSYDPYLWTPHLEISHDSVAPTASNSAQPTLPYWQMEVTLL